MIPALPSFTSSDDVQMAFAAAGAATQSADEHADVNGEWQQRISRRALSVDDAWTSLNRLSVSGILLPSSPVYSPWQYIDAKERKDEMKKKEEEEEEGRKQIRNRERERPSSRPLFEMRIDYQWGFTEEPAGNKREL